MAKALQERNSGFAHPTGKMSAYTPHSGVRRPFSQIPYKQSLSQAAHKFIQRVLSENTWKKTGSKLDEGSEPSKDESQDP